MSSPVRFLGGHAPRRDLLAVLSFPVGYDNRNIEHTRFFMTNQEKWVHQPFESDLVSVVQEVTPQGKAWWLVGKRGDIHIIPTPTGDIREEFIEDAGTGPGKLGYLSALCLHEGKLWVCGYRRQIYVRGNQGWEHRDSGILLGREAVGYGLHDIVGNTAGTLCAVGFKGEIVLGSGGIFTLQDSPTNKHLNAVCVDDQGRFCAAGTNGIVVRGDASGFEVLCVGDLTDPLWDIEFFQGELVVSATAGLFIVRNGTLAPFDKPPVPKHEGYRLTQAGGLLWSIGEDHIFCLDDGRWTEWVCPDNVP